MMEIPYIKLDKLDYPVCFFALLEQDLNPDK